MPSRADLIKQEELLTTNERGVLQVRPSDTLNVVDEKAQTGCDEPPSLSVDEPPVPPVNEPPVPPVDEPPVPPVDEPPLPGAGTPLDSRLMDKLALLSCLLEALKVGVFSKKDIEFLTAVVNTMVSERKPLQNEMRGNDDLLRYELVQLLDGCNRSPGDVEPFTTTTATAVSDRRIAVHNKMQGSESGYRRKKKWVTELEIASERLQVLCRGLAVAIEHSVVQSGVDTTKILNPSVTQQLVANGKDCALLAELVQGPAALAVRGSRERTSLDKAYRMEPGSAEECDSDDLENVEEETSCGDSMEVGEANCDADEQCDELESVREGKEGEAEGTSDDCDCVDAERGVISSSYRRGKSNENPEMWHEKVRVGRPTRAYTVTDVMQSANLNQQAFSAKDSASFDTVSQLLDL